MNKLREDNEDEFETSCLPYLLATAQGSPNAENMDKLISGILRHLRRGGTVPLEVLEYPLERFQVACRLEVRKGPVAQVLGISRGVDTSHKRRDIARTICRKAFDCRHREDPFQYAIKRLCSSRELDIPVDSAQRIWRKYGQFVLVTEAYAWRQDSRKKDFYRKFISSDLRDRFDRDLAS